MATDDTAQKGDLVVNLTPPVKNEHGAQNVLTGKARAAARGGLHGDIASNTFAREAAVAAGEAGDGTTPDASTPDGRLPPDVATGSDQPAFGPPGEGEGKPGFRPGDEKVLQAQADAAQQRAKVKEQAQASAPAPVAQPAAAPAAAPAPAPAAAPAPKAG